METALFWMVAVLVATQVVRVMQNAIQLHAKNKIFQKQVDGIIDINNEDIEWQREAYRLIVKFLRVVMGEEK